MSSYSSAPPPRAKIGYQDQPVITVPKAGLQIVPGVGLTGRTEDGRLLLDANRQSSPETVCLYSPGPVTARNIGVWANLRPSRSAVVVGADLNLDTAPTGATAVDCFALRLTDQSGATALLPMDSNSRRAVLDRGDGQVVARQRSQDPTNAVSGIENHSALVQRFTPTQDMTITGVDVSLRVTAFKASGADEPVGVQGGAILEARVRAVITNAAGEVILSGETLTTGTNAAGDPPEDIARRTRRSIGFPLSARLVAGDDYFLGLEIVSPRRAAFGPQELTVLQTGFFGSAVASQPLDPARADLCAYIVRNNHPEGQAIDWKQAISGQGGWTALDFPPSFLKGGFVFALRGAGGGIITRGDVSLDLVTIGAPGPAAAGAGLNTRVMFTLGT